MTHRLHEFHRAQTVRRQLEVQIQADRVRVARDLPVVSVLQETAEEHPLVG